MKKTGIIMKIVTFFKRLFSPEPEKPFVYGLFCCISFVINAYAQSPLRGCHNDQKRIVARIKQFWSQFVFRLFKDQDATWQRFEAEVLKAFANMPTGWLVIHYSGHGTYKRNPREIDGFSEALYFINGSYADYQFYELLKKKPAGLKVVIILDCCFSTGATVPRVKYNPHYKQARFLASEPMPENFKVSKRAIIEEDIDWIVFAACGERETAADAYINGDYTGAFTWYFSQIMRPGIFFANWQKEVDKYLPSNDFKQSPSLTGSNALMHELPFEMPAA